MLTRVKDTLPEDKQFQEVYRIPCRCSKVYIRETIKRLKTSLKEHQKACREGTSAVLAVAEHMHKHQHPIKGVETAIVDQTTGHQELLLKEAIHIC